MAVDLRIPADSAARSFIERSLLAMERAGVLDVTRERSPAHYHIAVFADAWAGYAATEDSLAVIERARVAAATTAAERTPSVAVTPASTGGGSLPAFLLGMVALVGMTAPVMYRGSRTKRRSDGGTV